MSTSYAIIDLDGAVALPDLIRKEGHGVAEDTSAICADASMG